MALSDDLLGCLADRLLKQSDAMVQLVVDLAAIESPTSDLSSQRRVVSKIEDWLKPLGYRARWIRVTGAEQSRPTDFQSAGVCVFVPKRDFAEVLPHRAGKSRRQMLLGHVDTVWPLGTLEKMPIHQADQRLYGPGVFDMKGGIVQAMFALKVICDLSLTPTLKPIMLLNTNEETGSPGTSEIIRTLAACCDRVFVLEPPVGHEGLLKTERRGGGFITLKVEGRAAHAGLNPTEGRNAIDKMVRTLNQLEAIRQRFPSVNFSPGLIHGGIAANVVAPHCEVVVDVRLSSQNDLGRIKQELNSLVSESDDFRVDLEMDLERPPMEGNDRNQRLWESASRLADRLGFEIDQTAVGGGSDGNFTSPVAATLDGLGAVGAGAHQSNEHLMLADLPKRAALLAALMMEQPA